MKNRVLRFLGSFEFNLSSNEYWGLLFIGCLSLFVSKLIFVALLFLAFKIKLTRKKSFSNTRNLSTFEIENIVSLIHLNQLQLLSEAIELNPQLLYCSYKKKSLLLWCNHYNNTKAVLVVNELSQKYPKMEHLAA
jgi:hypothetical protein